MFTLDWLGPTELRRDGVALPMTVRKALALLVLLAREGSLPRERVAAWLWPSLDESTGRRNLRRELVRLRDAGATDVVSAQGDRLALGSDVAISARLFEEALNGARPDEALALWRGAPADGLYLEDAPPWNEWMAQERHRLEGLHLQALALSAQQHEATGANDIALERVRRLLVADPLQEQHHRAAMRLLDRLGQRAAALLQYDACVRLLADELGLAPMAQTRALAEALRAGPDAAGRAAVPLAAVAPAPARPADLLPDELPFVGREQEVARLERAWSGRRPVLVEGEGGVGKTRLVSDFAAAHGPYAIVACRAGDAELPLASFTRALRALAGPEPSPHGLPGWVHGELARLMPELGPAPPPLRSEDERTRFAQACALAWQHWAAGNFDAIVIDDWHLADAGSQALWLQVHAALESPVRLFVVYRPNLSTAAAERLLQERQGGAKHLRLEPLPADAVLELVQRLSGRPEPKRFASMLARATDGNPFYMAETLRHLVERGLLTAAADGSWQTPFDDSTEGYEELPLPESVRSAVLGRVARLPEPARRVLEAAALADEPFAAALLAPACALSEVEASLALEDALSARLLREADDGGLAFVHHLVQQALDSALAPARRRSVHRRLALGAAAAGAPPARIAAHHEAGGEARRAVPWRRRAGDEAMRLHALDDAIAQWRQALADGADADEDLAIRVALMRALEMRDEVDGAQAEAADILQRAAQGQASPTRCIEAQVAVAYLFARRDRSLQALAVLDALPATLEPRQQALALNARATAMHKLDRPDEATRLAEAALALDGLTLEERRPVLDSLIDTLWYRGRHRDALPLVAQARALALAANDRGGVMQADNREGAMLTQLGELQAAEVKLRAAAAQAAELGRVAYQRNILFNLCVLLGDQGRLDAVLEIARTCWDLKPPMPLDMQRVLMGMALAESHWALGDLGAAYPWVLRGIDDALALGRVFGAAAVSMTGAEVLGLLGEDHRLAPLRALLELPEARSVLVAREAWVALADGALLTGRVDEALDLQRHVADIDVDGLSSPRTNARFAISEAALTQAAGDPAAALAGLPADDAPGLNDELRLRALAVRLCAEADLGEPGAATLAAADAALAAPGAHAVAALLLHHALLQRAPTPARRLAWERRGQALLLTLESLAEPRAHFERHWLRVGA